MKARIKATGEVIEVNCGTAVAGNVLYRDVNTNATYTGDELEPAEPDWQHYRIQAAIAIVQGWASTPQGLTKVCMAGAVELADALIAELQKKGGQDD